MVTREVSNLAKVDAGAYYDVAIFTSGGANLHPVLHSVVDNMTSDPILSFLSLSKKILMAIRPSPLFLHALWPAFWVSGHPSTKISCEKAQWKEQPTLLHLFVYGFLYSKFSFNSKQRPRPRHGNKAKRSKHELREKRVLKLKASNMNMNFHYMPFLTAFVQPEDLDRQVSTYNGSKPNLLSKLRTKNKKREENNN